MPAGTMDNPIIVGDTTNRASETCISLEDLADGEEVVMEKTEGLLREVLRTYTTNYRERARKVPKKRSFETFCRSHEQDSEVARGYLEEQDRWHEDVWVAFRALEAHLKQQRTKRRGALGWPVE
jgi:hypothetical protein